MTTREHDLEVRLARLELDHRRLRRHARTATATAVLVGALGLAGMAAPRLCNTVTAERFVLEDAHGRTRMLLDAYGREHPSILFKNAAGADVAALEVGADALDLKVFRDGKAVPARLRLEAEDAPSGDADKSVN